MRRTKLILKCIFEDDIRNCKESRVTNFDEYTIKTVKEKFRKAKGDLTAVYVIGSYEEVYVIGTYEEVYGKSIKMPTIYGIMECVMKNVVYKDIEGKNSIGKERWWLVTLSSKEKGYYKRNEQEAIALIQRHLRRELMRSMKRRNIEEDKA